MMSKMEKVDLFIKIYFNSQDMSIHLNYHMMHKIQEVMLEVPRYYHFRFNEAGIFLTGTQKNTIIMKSII